MRPSIRFLAVALVGWMGVRTITLGAFPGAQLFTISTSEAKSPPPVIATEFPPLDPMPEEPGFFPEARFEPPGAQPIAIQPAAMPYYYTAAPAPALESSLPASLPDPVMQFRTPMPAFEQWLLARFAPISIPPTNSMVVPVQSRPAVAPKRSFNRLQLTTWALLRGQQGIALGTPSLAGSGSLGASQAGARLAYNFTPQIAASFRTTSDVGRRGAEVAGGIRVRPLRSLPVWITAERRQRIGDGTGRNAFALFAEGGIYQRPMPWDFDLDAYLQAGVVGFRSRDAFIDGGLSVTRPFYRQFSAGFGVWGAAQPGVYRLDGGPRVSMKVRDNLRVHFDWRQRLAGNAAPASGPALTLAGDF